VHSAGEPPSRQRWGHMVKETDLDTAARKGRHYGLASSRGLPEGRPPSRGVLVSASRRGILRGPRGPKERLGRRGAGARWTGIPRPGDQGPGGPMAAAARSFGPARRRHGRHGFVLDRAREGARRRLLPNSRRGHPEARVAGGHRTCLDPSRRISSASSLAALDGRRLVGAGQRPGARPRPVTNREFPKASAGAAPRPAFARSRRFALAGSLGPRWPEIRTAGQRPCHKRRAWKLGYGTPATPISDAGRWRRRCAEGHRPNRGGPPRR